MNATQFPAVVDRMSAALESEPLTDCMERCHDHVAAGIHDCFLEGISPDGEIWPPRKGTASHRLMHETGALEAAATTDGAPGHVKRIGYREMQIGVEVGTEGSLAGAAAHNFGATIYPRFKKFLVFFIEGIGWIFAKKVVIPKRQFIGATPQAAANCREEIQHAVRERVFQQ